VTRDLAVPEPLGDHLHLHPGAQRQAGIGMSQVVQPNWGAALSAQLAPGSALWRTRAAGSGRPHE
jgi:hypothetical protein